MRICQYYVIVNSFTLYQHPLILGEACFADQIFHLPNHRISFLTYYLPSEVFRYYS